MKENDDDNGTQKKKQMKITEMKPKTMKLRDYLTVIFAKVSQKKKHLSKYVTTILGIAELVNIYWIQFWCVLFCSCRVINQVTLDEINEGKNNLIWITIIIVIK